MNQNERKKRDLLVEIAEINERISEQNKRAATATGSELVELENRIASQKILLQAREDELDVVKDILAEEKKQAKLAEERNKRQQEANDLQDEFATSFTRMGNQQKKFLTDSNSSSNSYANITAKIVELKQQEVDASDDDRAILAQRRAILEGIRTEQIEAAEAAAMARQEMFGISDAEQRRNEFQQSIAGLSQDEKDMAEATFAAKENLLLQQERYNQLQNAGNEILGKLPAGVQSVVGGIKNMISGIRAFGIEAAIATAGITLVIGAIIAGVDYMMGMEKASEEFRKETGVTNSMMADMNDKAVAINKQYASYGVNLEDAYDTMAALRDETSEVANYSEAAVAGLTLMKTNFGVSAEEAAKVQGVLESVGGLSEDTAVNVQMQVANMAKLAGVAPKKVLKDIADNAEAASTFFKGDITLLSQQAVQARRLGTNLKEVTATAEKLLDFENNIEQELVAATYVGGQFNLNRARALAMEGKLVEAQEETLKQIQRSGDFRQQDYFTQQQLAKAANMSVEEINKQLNAQEKLGKLNEEDKKRAQEAIDAGLDITNLNDEQLMQEVQKAAAQKEMASTITDMENTFKGILASVGGALLPIFQMLAPILTFAFFPLKVAAKMLQFLIDGIIWLLKKIPFVGDMVDKIGSLTGQVDSAVNNFSVAGLEGGGMGSVVEAGDVISPANGQTMISTKEGGLLKLSGNDDVVAAPGAASAIGGGSSLAALSAPLNAMINEIKALRADLAAGKIAVNMDGARVSAGIGKIVDGSSRNNFSMG
jgi:phosphoserine phosphatase